MGSSKIERHSGRTMFPRRLLSTFHGSILDAQYCGRAIRSMSHVACAGVAIALAGALMAADTLAQAPAKQASVKLSDTTPQAMHRLAIQVDQNDKAVMDLALNNAKNVIDYYASKNESVAVEVVTFGPGLHMLRSDTSPVKERIAVMSLENSNLTFAACGNTQANQSKVENKPVVLITEAKLTPSGVVRLMELQKQGYAYIRP
jgi:intracellular sulfur oxidation DsrE/DsrF family protein